MALVAALLLCTTGCKIWHTAKGISGGGGGAAGTAAVGERPVHNLPPAQRLFEPGPGVGGPGPGVIAPEPVQGVAERASQVSFVGPPGMQIAWDVGAPGMFDSEPLIAPGRYDFPQGAIYRLKLTNIPGRPGVELYPSLEIGPTLPRTDAYLAHNSIPVQFTEEDFDQVLTGNFVTKVIYLPDPEFQPLAIAGVEELVSTRLDPGVDPIVEADRRGAIMAIVRMGNKDLQAGGPGAAGLPGGVVHPIAYNAPLGHHGYAGAVAGGPLPFSTHPTGAPNYVSGINTPQYGMVTSGTPIGLPGPPHIPFGIPAGLQHHSITNHTHMKIPPPNHHLDIHVRQRPGFSYPKPVTQISVDEQVVPYGSGDPNCPPYGH
jgi:hypothetical protein